jgi:hypothetical protein
MCGNRHSSRKSGVMWSLAYSYSVSHATYFGFQYRRSKRKNCSFLALYFVVSTYSHHSPALVPLCLLNPCCISYPSGWEAVDEGRYILSRPRGLVQRLNPSNFTPCLEGVPRRLPFLPAQNLQQQLLVKPS